MATRAPGSEQRPKTPGQQGTNSPGGEDRNRGDQMEQKGRQDQPGGSQRSNRQQDRNPGAKQDKENDRSKSGAQRPD